MTAASSPPPPVVAARTLARRRLPFLAGLAALLLPTCSDATDRAVDRAGLALAGTGGVTVSPAPWAAGAGAETAADAATEAEAATEAATEAESETETETEAEAEAEAETETETETETDEAATEPESETEPEAETEANPEAEPATDPPAAPPRAASLLDAALSLAREDHPDLDAEAVRAELADLARRYAALLPAGAGGQARAAAFATLLFGGSRAFRSIDDLESLEGLHIDSVLRERAGYCLSLSIVALIVADLAGEPLHGVSLPNHFFVRWDDGRERFNLELTRGGEQIADADLRARLGDAFYADSLYLQNLDDDQVLGVLLHNRAYAALAAGRPEQALRDLARAELLVPELPEVHRTRGIALGEQQRWPAAIVAFERALALHPGDVDALLNLALCRRASGDLAGAIEDASLVLLLDPTRQRAATLLEDWRKEQRAHALPRGARALDDPPPGLRPGLLGRYFRGISFEQVVHERVDRDLDFDWQRDGPAPKVPSDRFSVRWEGWFKAPETAVYTLFVVANDGVRVCFGDDLAIDHWQDTGNTSWTGSGDVALLAGFHPVRVEHYDRSGNARLVCLVGLEGREYPLELAQHLFHERPERR